MADASLGLNDEVSWITQLVTDSDAILSARVVGVEPEFLITRTLGDWAYLVSGSRLGFPDHATECVLRLERGLTLKGMAPSEHSLRYACPSPESDVHSDIRGVPMRIEVGHDYIFFFERKANGLSLSLVVDLKNEPDVLPEIEYNLRRSASAPPAAQRRAGVFE